MVDLYTTGWYLSYGTHLNSITAQNRPAKQHTIFSTNTLVRVRSDSREQRSRLSMKTKTNDNTYTFLSLHAVMFLQQHYVIANLSLFQCISKMLQNNRSLIFFTFTINLTYNQMTNKENQTSTTQKFINQSS